RQLTVLAAKLPACQLQVARNAQRSRAVTQVAADLSFDQRPGKGRKGHAAALIEAAARLDQAHRADLDEVVERLPLSGVAAGQRVSERQMRVHHARAPA